MLLHGAGPEEDLMGGRAVQHRILKKQIDAMLLPVHVDMCICAYSRRVFCAYACVHS